MQNLQSILLTFRFSMPYTPLRQLKPDIFRNEYETDSEDDFTDTDSGIDDEFNLDGLDIDDDVPDRGWEQTFSHISILDMMH